MKNLFLVLSCALFSSCAMVGESLIDGIMSSIFKSSKDKKIDSDTHRLLKGEELRHFPSESRLRAAREARILDDLMTD